MLTETSYNNNHAIIPKSITKPREKETHGKEKEEIEKKNKRKETKIRQHKDNPPQNPINVVGIEIQI